ncbi:SpaH/EbpB family LPXTG-anchored major pilin [Thomasclavelia spiroformis DSM 1552]|uniref:LPXTG-motif cell wall anchor domain protein n=1 Tax=Thomasclavelia spiroformis DSM 1552 TaxID=428126 RepID=B1C0G5_9FIRM|nr:SpaH/EbpB family LPXTG-anchored major pilin [Thomasclavelia spiroformis]EDS75300.1 LPXTG-motif cell wall anchor domain protein [Thomasclavelia spiroformis DSM 1552]UWO88658.1 SpaH/EbpB family LPXTG-anchored major pilin [Thomasclavelia spiroformis DSM 1552]
MKVIKKIFSLMLVFLVGFALTLPAGASDKVDPKDNPEIDLSKTTGSITINKEGSTFSIYKILDAVGKEGQNVYNYTVNSNFINLIGEGKAYSLEKIATMPNQLNINNYDDEGNLIGVTDPITEETSKFTSDVQAYIEANSIQPTATIPVSEAGETKVTLDIGFYIIIETGTSGDSASVASKSMLVPLPYVDVNKAEDNKLFWNFDLTITPKDEPVNVDKSIIEGDKKENISDNNVGDILTYQVDADIPHYDASTNTQMVKYIITDTLSKGLDFYREGDPENNIDIIVSNFSGESKTLKPGTLETHETTIGEEPYTYYSVTDGDYAVSYDGKTMTLVFDYPDIMAYNNLQLNYQVRINEDAVIGVEGNPNQVDLEYTNNNKTWNTSKPWDKTETYVYGLKINKVDPDGNKLEGAEFQLYAGAPDPDGDYEGRNPLVTYKYENGQLVINSNDGKTAVTDKDGIAYLIGFEAGTYTLVETKAPNGYIIPDGQMQLDVVETIGVDEDGKEAVTDVKYTLTTGDEVTELPTEVLGDVEIGDGSVAVTKIVNPKGFNLPRTGGAGTWMFAVGGILIMAGMATAFVKLRKKEN